MQIGTCQACGCPISVTLAQLPSCLNWRCRYHEPWVKEHTKPLLVKRPTRVLLTLDWIGTKPKASQD